MLKRRKVSNEGVEGGKIDLKARKLLFSKIFADCGQNSYLSGGLWSKAELHNHKPSYWGAPRGGIEASAEASSGDIPGIFLDAKAKRLTQREARLKH